MILPHAEQVARLRLRDANELANGWSELANDAGKSSPQTSLLPVERLAAGRPLKRALMGRTSELHQSSFTREANHVRPWLRIIEDPISKLNPEMLYRHV